MNAHETTGIRELTAEEMEAAAGGWWWHALLTPLAVIVTGAVLIGMELSRQGYGVDGGSQDRESGCHGNKC